MARALKVYRTVAGFHDAYVAAPSQKAALAAWGSDKDLFARGDAERVEDPDLMAAPLADPGTVIRLSRGTTAAQIAALPDRPALSDRPVQDRPDDDIGRPQRKGAATPTKPAVTAVPAKPAAATKSTRPAPPKPDNDRLVASEEALASLQAAQRAERRDLADREAALARERRSLDRRHRTDEDALQAAVDEAKAAYDAAVKRWKA